MKKMLVVVLLLTLPLVTILAGKDTVIRDEYSGL